MRAAALGAGFGPILIWLLRSARQEDWRGTSIGLAALLVSGFMLRVAGRWFDRRFGRVIRSHDEKDAWWPFLWGACTPIVLRLDEWSLNAGGPSPILLGLAALGLWFTIRDWPYRPQLVVFFATCLIAGLALGEVSDRADFLEWRIRAESSVVLAWMVVGACDLFTLFRVLPRPADMPEHGTHVDSV
jgi:hypothetical protein